MSDKLSLLSDETISTIPDSPFTSMMRNLSTESIATSLIESPTELTRVKREILALYMLTNSQNLSSLITRLSQIQVPSYPIIELVEEEDDWTLNTDQMFFMMEHNNLIMDAYATEDMKTLSELAATEEYKAIFGTMSFDEAFDRYETMLEDEGGNS